MTYYYSNAENVEYHRKWDQRMREKSKVENFLDKTQQITYKRGTEYQQWDERQKKLSSTLNFGNFF